MIAGAGSPILFSLVRRQATRSVRQLGHPRLLRGGVPLPAPYLRIYGVTKDSVGAPLGSCTVHLFVTLTDLEVDEMSSDGAGNYEFRSASLSTAYYVVAYLPGSPDRAGTTVNTLLGA